jgi:nucleoid-associated protein YgaU
MPNKQFFFAVLLCICVSVFAQTEADNFIDNYYWYRKYLPQENISEYYALKNALVYLKDSDAQAFKKLSMDLSEPVFYLNGKVHESLQNEISRAGLKMEILAQRYGTDTQVKILAGQLAELEALIKKGFFPADDSCLVKIDELYSRLVTRLGYVFLNDRTYHVKKGDYLRKIAAMFYENELLWELIYNENKNDRDFLPNQQNPDLIYPGVIILIPPKPE